MDAAGSGFYVGSGDQTRGSVLVWQSIKWLNHLPTL